jgi:hypothetical protein
MQKKFTKEEISFIKENYAQYGSTKLAKKLNRSVSSISHFAQRYKLHLIKTYSTCTHINCMNDATHGELCANCHKKQDLIDNTGLRNKLVLALCGNT